jgi:peptidoglycan hydrolase CwlO-like protein
METNNETTEVVDTTPVDETIPTPPADTTTDEVTTPPQEVETPKEEEASYEEIVEQLVAYIDELEVKQVDFNKQIEDSTSLLAERDQSLEQLNEQLKELNNLKTTIDAIESAWTKVSTHDII